MRLRDMEDVPERHDGNPLAMEGEAAPDFTLYGDDGKEYSLAMFRGKKVVLYFYPKDGTPGCSAEACAFRDSVLARRTNEVQLLGISNDDVKSHRDFKAKYLLNFPLLADTDASVSRAYGVYKEFDFDGEKVWAIDRSTFVIGKTGRVERAFRSVEVEGHVDAVASAL